MGGDCNGTRSGQPLQRSYRPQRRWHDR
ncbi:MAG: hypothetical protein PVF53_04150 [Desulfobacterales bacterium]